MSENFKTIALQPDGSGKTTVDLGALVISLETRYNYSAECWVMDVLDAQDEALLTGLKLVPNVDLLKPHTQVKKSIGSLALVELNDGDYKSPDLLGINTLLLWFAPGGEVVLP